MIEELPNRKMHKLNKYLDLKDKSEIKNDEKDNEVNSIID